MSRAVDRINLTMMRMTIPLLVLALLPACDQSSNDPAGDAPDAKASAAATDDTKAAAADDAPARDPKVDEALAALGKQALPLSKDNHDRNAVCEQMRTLAGAAADCKECLETYVKVVEGEGTQRIVDCSAQDLARVTEGADKLCSALVSSWKNSSQPNSRAIEAFATLGAACKPQLDAFVDVAVERFESYENEYGALGAANVIYVERILDHMTAEQKAKIAAAAEKLEKLAREKKDKSGRTADRLADQAKKLADAAK